MLLATDFFVSGTGDDANDGLSSGTAFRTITRAMQGTGGGLQPGDRIVVAGGTYDTAAGEVFPIAVADGITILGPGDGTAQVKGPGVAGLRGVGGRTDLFTVGSLANTTVIRGLTMEGGTGTGRNTGTALIEVLGTPDDLQVLDNVFLNGLGPLWHIGSADKKAAGVLFQGNTVTGSRDDAFLWSTTSVTSSPAAPQAVGGGPGGPVHTLVIDNNTFNGGIVDDAVEIKGFSGAFFNVTVTGNTLDGILDDGIDFHLFAETSVSATGVFLVQNNTIRNVARSGIRFNVSATEANGLARADLTIRNNTLDVCGFAGLEMNQSGSDTALAEILGTIEFNTFTDLQSGIFGSITGTSTATAFFHPLIRYNCVAGSVDGMVFSLSQSGNGVIDFAPRVYGNVFLNNSGDDVRLSSSIETDTSILFRPDFGGGGAQPGMELGLNVFEGKDPGPGPGGNFDFEFGFGPASFMAPARGNWWGTFDGPTIESHVFHNGDNPFLGTVDFGGFLNPALRLKPSRKTILKKGGERLTMTAGKRSAFFAQAGNKMFAATLNGIPVINPVISADHTRITFTTPDLTAAPPLRGTSPDDAFFELVLPGGTVSGTFIFLFVLATTGIPFNPKCFLTTAAYGDRHAPEIGMFRRWRDESLAGSPLGRGLVRAYYAASPPLAEFVAAHPPLRAVSRGILAPVLGAVRLWLDAAWVYGLAGLLLAWRLLRRRRS
ncbi:MAG: CFI-box-CTERM domain-containing protein [Planctomycetota bacterium]